VPLDRTSLAWSRTGLGLAVAGALLVRYALRAGVPVLACTVGALLVAGSAATSTYASWSYERRVGALEGGRPVACALPLRLLTAAIALASLAVLAAMVATA
jgi:uncharacterized membrane protein YidH (DUF202 family)